MRREAISIKEEAVAYGNLIKITDSRYKVTTYYTKDYNKSYERKSYGIIYDKEVKLIKDNQTSHKKLHANPYKLRLELKLSNITADWLHLDNLKGNYNNIMNRYIDLLIIIYKNYFENYIIVNKIESKYLYKIVHGAKNIDKVRFTNPDGKLKKQNPIPKEQLSQANNFIQSEKYKELADTFLTQIENLCNDEKFVVFCNLLDEID